MILPCSVVSRKPPRRGVTTGSSPRSLPHKKEAPSSHKPSSEGFRAPRPFKPPYRFIFSPPLWGCKSPTPRAQKIFRNLTRVEPGDPHFPPKIEGSLSPVTRGPHQIFNPDKAFTNPWETIAPVKPLFPILGTGSLSIGPSLNR